MDPNAIEIAKLLFAGISAASAAVQVWYRSQDARKAAATFDNTYKTTLDSPEAASAATELVAIIPGDIIRDLEQRADNCWTGYREVLGGDYLPSEIDKATVSVQACVCRELCRIDELNGSIPPKWMGQWDRYDCKGRSKLAHKTSPAKPSPRYRSAGGA